MNKKKVNISSYVVKSTDLIEIRDKSKKLVVIEGAIQSKERENFFWENSIPKRKLILIGLIRLRLHYELFL